MPYGLEALAPSESGIADFKECLKHLRDEQPDEALADVRRALRTAPENPFYLSYAGLLTALVEGKFRDAEKLCRQALSLRHNHAQLYLNLAEVYQRAGRPQEALDVLEKGWTSAGRDHRIRQALNNFGARRNPVIPVFERSNPINYILGKCRHRLLGPKRTA